jgi:hypothetical protein
MEESTINDINVTINEPELFYVQLKKLILQRESLCADLGARHSGQMTILPYQPGYSPAGMVSTSLQGVK